MSTADALHFSPDTAASNGEIIRRFDQGWPDAEFHHADHVRVAYAYLAQFPPLRALENFSAALNRFAAARGKASLYHETITWAFMFLIRERMARTGAANWQEFAQQNADLLEWKGGVLSRYYREETLASDLARSVFVLPDPRA